MPNELCSINTLPMIGLIDLLMCFCARREKIVMGFDSENHAQEAHQGKGVEWVKVR